MNTPNSPIKPLTSEELRARQSAGHPHPGIVEDDMRRLELALDSAHREEGKAPVESPVDRQMFGLDTVTHRVEWMSGLFGKVTIGLKGQLGMGQPIQLDRFTKAVPISLAGQPDQITFTVERKLEPGVRLLRGSHSDFLDCTEGTVSEFSVPINWVPAGPRGSMVPETIQFKRDFSLLFLDTGTVDRKGAFLQLDVSLSTRRGTFFLVFQQAYGGQVVSTTHAKAEELGLTTVTVGHHVGAVVPLFEQNAYPGSNYFKNFEHLAAKVVGKAIELGAYAPLSSCVVARWNPSFPELPETLRSQGWTGGSVSWFNAVIGWGFLYCEDKKPCFVHFKQIVDASGSPVFKKGAFPMLTPMRPVMVRYEEQDGKRKATAVRAL